MIYVKLHFPIILRKQLPGIAKQMNVPEKELEDLLTNRSFYATKDEKNGVYAMPENNARLSAFLSGFKSPRFGSGAVIEYAKAKGVEVHPIKEIKLDYELFSRYPRQAFADIAYLAHCVEVRDSRAFRLDALNAPEVIIMNELRMLQEAVEVLEDNDLFGKHLSSDGRVLKSLRDIGWSLVNGSEREAVEYNEEEDKLGYSPSQLAVLVKRAIGTDTQEKFASKAGLARAYLGRLANGKSTSIPTETTLKKIAKATREVTENELRLACGYASLPSDEREVNTKRRATLSDTDWAKDNVKSFLDFLGKMIPLIEPLSSLNILRTSYGTLFFDDGDKIYMEAVGERSEYHADGTAANVILPARVRWFSFDRMLVQTMYFALIGHMSADNEFYVTGYLTSVKDLYASVPALRGKVDSAVDANLPDGIDVMEFPVFYSTTHVKAALDKVKQEIIDKCNSYLDNCVKVRIDGYGFFSDTLDEDTFKKFLKNHEAVMTNDTAPGEIKDFYENVVANDGNVEDFLVEDSDYDTVASVIAYVANAEHKNTYHCNAVDGFNNTPDSPSTESCVLSSDIGTDMFKEHFGLNRDDVCADLKAYAAELGLPYGRVSCYMMVEDKDADGCGVRV